MVGFKITGNANLQSKAPAYFYDNEIEEFTIRHNGVPLTETPHIFKVATSSRPEKEGKDE